MPDSRLACGPFANVKNAKGNFIIFPLACQGDWAGTTEGDDLLKAAYEKILASDELPDDVAMKRDGPGRMKFTIKCENAATLAAKAPAIKQTILRLTNAFVIEPVREQGED